jgi:peptide/nickel transport system permease protein
MIAFLKKYEGLWLFVHSPAAIVAALVAGLILLGAVFAPWIALVNPYDLASFSLFDGLLPPVWEEGANPKFLLGTDDQGRDMISSILYGARLSLIIGIFALTIAALLLDIMVAALMRS